MIFLAKYSKYASDSLLQEPFISYIYWCFVSFWTSKIAQSKICWNIAKLDERSENLHFRNWEDKAIQIGDSFLFVLQYNNTQMFLSKFPRVYSNILSNCLFNFRPTCPSRDILWQCLVPPSHATPIKKSLSWKYSKNDKWEFFIEFIRLSKILKSLVLTTKAPKWSPSQLRGDTKKQRKEMLQHPSQLLSLGPKVKATEINKVKTGSYKHSDTYNFSETWMGIGTWIANFWYSPWSLRKWCSLKKWSKVTQNNITIFLH